MIKSYIIVPFIVLSLGLAIIIPIGVTQYYQEQAREIDEHKRFSELYSKFIENEIRYFIEKGRLMQVAYTLNNNIDRITHQRLAQNIINVDEGIQAIAWDAKILDTDRAMEETEASMFYNQTLFFKDFFTQQSVAKKPVYYPILVTWPLVGNKPSLLLDVSSGPLNSVLNTTIASGDVFISNGITLIQETGEQIGVVMLYPVYTGIPRTLAEYFDQHIGFVNIVLRMFDWLVLRISLIQPSNTGIYIIDNRNNVLLAAVEGSSGSWVKIDKILDGGLNVTISVGQTEWTVRTSIVGKLVDDNYYLIFAIGIPVLIMFSIISGIITYLLHKTITDKILLMEKEKQINNSKQVFINYIFHEIRVPFQTIKLGLLNLKKYLIESTDSNNTWLTINNCIDHASIILNDILDIGKMEKGKFTINKTACYMIPNLKLAIEAHTIPITEKGVAFTYHIHNDIRTHSCNLDINRIMQCVNNLLSNAQKYTIEGFVEFTVDIVDKWLEDNVEYWTLKFQVSDSGIGISDLDQQILFQPYQQIQNESNEIGTGLGLVITKNIVSLHNGTMGVESKEKEGSKFWFTIPVSVFELDKIPTETSESSANIPNSVLGKSILIVDDNKANCESLREYMINLGFENISFAYNGLNALESILEKEADNPIDVIFMDMHMPKMNGKECVKEIRKRYERNIYIIMLTGAHIEEKELFDIGVNDVLQKPLQTEKFKQSLIKYNELNEREVLTSDVVRIV